MTEPIKSKPYETRVLQRLQHAWPWGKWKDFRVLVAVSGGADSVALLRALILVCHSHSVDAGDKLVVGHVNHRIRERADEDSEFVAKLAVELGLSFQCETLLNAGQEPEGGRGLEDILRQHRYSYLSTMAEKAGTRFVAMGHHRDDQVETVLHRIFRGTAIAGLRGIPFTRPINEFVTVVRPMLDIPKSEILGFLNEIDQPFREDETNSDLNIYRNRMRHELVPLLNAKYSNELSNSILRLSESADETHDFVERVVDPLMGHVRFLSSGFSIDISNFPTREKILVTRVLIRAWTQSGLPLRDMSREKWNSIFEMLVGKKVLPTINLPNNVFVTRENNCLNVTVQKS